MKHPHSNHTWFVVGFAIAEDTKEVVLLEKQKSWCAGLWNGVGGLIEGEDERPNNGDPVWLATAQAAMAREFEEETGLATRADDWELYCDLVEPLCRVYFFRLFSTHDALNKVRKTTKERVALYHFSLAVTMTNVMPNLRWLVPMALHKALTLAQVEEKGGQYDGSR